MTIAGEGVPVEDYLYTAAAEILDKLFDSAEEISKISDKGIRLIMEAYRWVGIEAYKNRFCFFEEGSEHFLAYTIESICGKHLLHGQLVCMCVYIMSKLQNEGRQFIVKKFVEDIGLSIKPENVGLNENEVREALGTVNYFVVKNNLSYSILNEKKVSKQFIDEVLNEIKQI
jgi:glycerol dehydrogenase-like iron-containing ADH family enzyme